MNNKKALRKKHFKEQVRFTPCYLLLFLWLLFTIVVLCWITAASLSKTGEIFTGRLFDSGLHWENYKRVLVKHKMGVYFGNSLIYSISTCFGVITLAAPMAYVLGRFKFRGRRIINNLLILALSIPSIMMVLPLFKIATSTGLIGSRWTLILLYIGLNTPFGAFFLTGFFSNLPEALEDAAEIDGCGPFRVYWRIMLPLAQPGVVTLVIFQFIGIWNEYFIALIFGSKTQLRPLSTGLQTIVQSMRYSGDWAGLFAGVVIVALPTIILYMFLSNKIIAGVTSGAVKE